MNKQSFDILECPGSKRCARR